MTRPGIDLRETAKIMSLAVAGLFALLLIVGELIILFVYQFELPYKYALGLTLGSGLSLLKVVLLTRSIDKGAGSEDPNAAGKTSLHFVFRYGLTIVVLACVVIFKDYFGLFGAIGGILTLQLSAYVTNIVLSKKYPDVPVEAKETDEDEPEEPYKYDYKANVIEEIKKEMK